MKELLKLSSLRKLSLVGLNIGDGGVAELCIILKESMFLRSLELVSTQISRWHSKIVSALQEGNFRLRSVSFNPQRALERAGGSDGLPRQEEIGSKIAAWLLRTDTAFQELCIRVVNLSEMSILLIVDALTRNSYDSTINVSHQVAI